MLKQRPIIPFFLTILIVAVALENAGYANASVRQHYNETSSLKIVDVHLQRYYLDGEYSEEIIKEKVYTMEELFEKYHDWELIDRSASKVVFMKHIDDISPLLKTNGYFGITEDGILTIFDGKPTKEKTIQSFYQLDTEKLESRTMQQLQAGIPIRTKDRFLHVMNELNQYAIK